MMLRRHAGYTDFVAGWYGEAQPMPWWQRVIEINGARLQVAGLNSAWMCCGDEDRSRLLLGRYQLTQTVLTREAEDADWRIVLVHHLWSYLAEFESDDYRELVHQHADLILRGHLHRQPYERVVPPDPTRQCLELAAGCVYEHSQYPNAFQWIELSSTGKRVRVLPRAWLHSAWSIDRNQPNCHDGYSAFEFGGDSVEPPIPPGRLVFKAFGTGNEDPFSDNLPPDAWKCYEDLFPIPTERDKFEDVLRWVNQGRHYANGWKELLCTMQEGTRCVGFAFISLYPPLGWWFGNYFGVNKSYRENGRASTFLRFIRERCESIERNSKGLIFEVERYEEKHIQGIIAKCEASQSSRPKRKIMLTPEEKYSLDALRRIALYTVRGLGSGLPNALAVVTKDKTDHPFLGK